MYRKRIVFVCPSCGQKSISFKKLEKTAIVRCSSCNISKEVPITRISEKEDIFGAFIDLYHGKEDMKINLDEINRELKIEKKQIIKKSKKIGDILEDKGFLED